MILVEETIKEFGYHPDELKPYSHKKIIVQCELCDKIRITAKSNIGRRPGSIKICRKCSLMLHPAKLNGHSLDTYKEIAKMYISDPNIHYMTIARKFNLHPHNIHKLLKGQLLKLVIKKI